MWWRKHTDPEKPLREQLTEACENVRRQIEVQSGAQHYLGAGMPNGGAVALAELQDELDRLEEALANLGPDNA
jgi:hypothetical protein